MQLSLIGLGERPDLTSPSIVQEGSDVPGLAEPDYSVWLLRFLTRLLRDCGIMSDNFVLAVTEDAIQANGYETK